MTSVIFLTQNRAVKIGNLESVHDAFSNMFISNGRLLDEDESNYFSS